MAPQKLRKRTEMAAWTRGGRRKEEKKESRKMGGACGCAFTLKF